jgi:hypothetical protein
VRGSPVQCPDVHRCATACSDALAASRAMALGGLQAQCEAARGFHFKCSRVRGLGTRECYNRSPRMHRLGRGGDGALANVLEQLHGACCAAALPTLKGLLLTLFCAAMHPCFKPSFSQMLY